jgi:hypothetical protein
VRRIVKRRCAEEELVAESVAHLAVSLVGLD